MHLSGCKIKSKRCLLGRETSQCAFVKNLYIDVANVVCTCQSAYAPVTLKIMYRCYFAKIYATLGNEISCYRISNFGPLKLDESRYIMKDIN